VVIKSTLLIITYEKALLTLVFVSTILQVNAQNGQVYVYLTSNYAGDSSLQNVYLAVMGAVETKTVLRPFGVVLRDNQIHLNKEQHFTL
jgi:hypothetical protein